MIAFQTLIANLDQEQPNKHKSLPTVHNLSVYLKCHIFVYVLSHYQYNSLQIFLFVLNILDFLTIAWKRQKNLNVCKFQNINYFKQF